MKFEIKKKVIKPLCIYSLAFFMLLPSVASLADLDINLGGYSVVYAQTAVRKPTVKPVAPGDKKITGGNLVGSNQRKKLNKDCIIHVTIKDASGVEIETANVSIKPTGGSKWTVNLTNAVKAGYKVYVKQEFNGGTSEEVSVEVKELLSKLYEGNLTMPQLEVWSEDLFVLESDAIDDIVNAFKAENNKLDNVDDKNFEGNLYVNKGGSDKKQGLSVAGDGKTLTVNFSDGSKIENLDISNKVTVKQITETSTAPTINTLKVTDSTITGKVDLKNVTAPERLRVEIVTNFDANELENFCTENGCSISKGSKVFATVNPETGEFSYDIGNSNVELGKYFGVIVKEYKKKNNCSKTTPSLAKPNKVDVRDPRQLTDEEKKVIDKAIREANTINGESKLPNGTGDRDGMPAVIQIDDSGNAKIFSGNDVAGTWDPNNDYKFVPEKNEDGSVKLNEGAEPKITIPAKDLVKNIKPEKPTVALSGDNKNITITPNKVDTDASKVEVTYTGKDGKSKTTTATKADDGNWSISGEGTVVNGVITLPKDKVKGGTDVTATVTDKGGIADDDKDPLTSDPGNLKIISKAEQINELGGLDPEVMKKWVGDEVNWKDGVKSKDDTKKDEVNKLLEGATFTDETETKRSTEKSGEFLGKIKVKFDDGSELTVENQKLMVCDHVTSTTDPKLPKDALDVQFKLGEGVKVEDKDPNSGKVTKTTKGDKDNPVIYKEYKVKPGTDFSNYKHPTLQKTIFDLIDEKADEGYKDPAWKDKNNGTNFVASDNNKVFTATATKLENKVKVTYDANGGSGTMEGAELTKGSKYKLLANGFTGPDNQEFAGWKIGDTEYAPDAEITVNEDTVVKAIWKDIKVKVSYDANGGSGEMKGAELTKGSTYKLLANGFTAPDNKKFAGWKIGETEYAPDAEITVNEDTTVTAQWKPKKDPGEDPGTKPGEDSGTNPGEDPGTTPGEDPGTKPGEDKPDKPQDPPNEEEFIPGIRHKDYTPTYPVYTVVPKTEKVEKLEEVPVSLETHKAYIAGYEDNTLRAEGNITRAEAAAMVTRLAGLDLSDNSMPNFKDMQKNAWYFRYINAAVKANMLDADNGMMRPNDKITRAEFAKMLAAIDKENSSVSKFEDIKGHRYEKEINKIYGNNRIEGYEDGSFRPDAKLTRAESAAFLNRMFNRIADKEAYAGLEERLAKFKDFDSSKWYYDEMVEATNSHELTRRGNASDKYGRVYEKWTRVLGNDVK